MRALRAREITDQKLDRQLKNTFDEINNASTKGKSSISATGLSNAQIERLQELGYELNRPGYLNYIEISW